MNKQKNSNDAQNTGMDKYSTEEIRRFLHYFADCVQDKAELYNAWVRLQRAYIK